MKKSLSLTLLAMLLVVVSAFSQLCTYSISGQALGSNGAVANGQLIFINTVNGIDSVYSNPNGFYSYSIQATCTSSITFTITPVGCIGGAISVDVSPNQPMTLTFEGCPGSSPTSPSCTTTANVSTSGNTIQYSQTASSNSGVTTSVLWNMGDGYTTNNYPNGGSHTYTAPGVYQACVTVTWSNGCSATDCETVTIGGNTPTNCIHTLNGYVTDAQNSQAVNGATITVNTSAGSYTGITNANGYYVIDILTSCDSSETVTLNTTGCGLLISEQLVVSPSTTLYSQDLVICESNPQESICGCITYVNAIGDTVWAGCGTALLIQLDSVSNSGIIIDSTSITPNGYCFYGNYSGNYIVWAQPCGSLSISANVLPTYTGNVLLWQDASNASLGMGNYSTNCITLVSGQNVQGAGQIGGNIFWGDDKAPGDPVANITVLLYDNNGNIIASTVTDAEGFYSFANLPFGTYQLYPEFPGYTTYPAYITLSPETPTGEVDNFYLGFGIFATAGIDESHISLAGLFPNPAKDMTVLSLNSKEGGTAKLSMMDITGKTVESYNVNVIKGQQNIILQMDNITSGMYTIVLTLNGQQINTKLIKQ